MGRRRTDNPLDQDEVCRLYLAGETIKSLGVRFRASDRIIRRALDAGSVPIRPQGLAGRDQRILDMGGTLPEKREKPARGGLTEREVQQLRRLVGFKPEWVQFPERFYHEKEADGRTKAGRAAAARATQVDGGAGEEIGRASCRERV